MEQRTENNLVEVEHKKSGKGNYERKTRGSYNKKSAIGKITVKHFVNKNLQPIKESLEDGKEILKYPVYVRITVKGQVTQVPSDLISDFFASDKDINKSCQILMIDEVENMLNPFHLLKLNPFENDKFSIKDFTQIHKILNTKVSHIVEILLFDIVKSSNNKNGLRNIRPYSFWNTGSAGGGKVMPSIRHIFHSQEDISKDKDALHEYQSEIWGLFSYEYLYYVKYALENKSESNLKFTISEIVSGVYQKEMEKVFGEDIMNPIFKDLKKLFKKYLGKHFYNIF